MENEKNVLLLLHIFSISSKAEYVLSSACLLSHQHCFLHHPLFKNSYKYCSFIVFFHSTPLISLPVLLAKLLSLVVVHLSISTLLYIQVRLHYAVANYQSTQCACLLQLFIII